MAFDKHLALMAGTDIPIPELETVLHQPKIKEIALIGDTDFFLGVQCLSLNKSMIDQGETLLADINNFQIFMKIMADKEAIDKKIAVQQFLQLIFPDFSINFTPRSLLLVGKENKTITIDENNFEILQENIKDICCINNSPMNTQNFNPQDARAKEIADKLMRARQRVAAQKGDDMGNIFSQYLSILTIGIDSMSLEDCLNLTMYQMFDLLERYMLWVNWDLDIRSRLAGGSSDSKPDNWMKNIH